MHASALADVPGETQHGAFKLAQVGFIIGAYIQAQGQLPGNLGQRMLFLIGVEATNGECHGPPFCVVPPPDVVEADRKVARGNNGIAAKASRQTDMRVFADDPDLWIAKVARYAGAN